MSRCHCVAYFICCCHCAVVTIVTSVLLPSSQAYVSLPLSTFQCRYHQVNCAPPLLLPSYCRFCHQDLLYLPSRCFCCSDASVLLSHPLLPLYFCIYISLCCSDSVVLLLPLPPGQVCAVAIASISLMLPILVVVVNLLVSLQ